MDLFEYSENTLTCHWQAQACHNQTHWSGSASSVSSSGLILGEGMRCMLKSDDLFKVSFNPCAINCVERVLVTRKGCQGKWSLYALTTDVGKRWILKRKNLANLKWSFRCSIKIKIKLCSVTVQHSTCHIFFSRNKFSPLSPSCGFSVLSFG